MSLLAESPPDTSRFGLRVLRGTCPGASARAVATEIIAAGCDVAIVRVPAGQGALPQGLARWAFPVVHADTLVYYQCALARLVPQPLRNPGLAFAPATQEDLPALRALIGTTFAGYRSHYHANPEFDDPSILAGYAEWAEGHLVAPGHSLWTLRDGSTLVAFAACREAPDADEAEGVLYGVAPEASGGGLYSDLIRHTQAHFKARGFARMKVSTQVGNFAVQKVWAREGFHMYEAFDTFHVNAMLSAGRVVEERDIVFSHEQVEAFAALSGDRNPVHLDDDAAAAAGFKGRITHGALAGAELSRVFGMEDPGPGTLYLKSSTAFLAPVLAQAPHRLKVRARDVAGKPGLARAVSTIHDASGELCLLDYSDLLLRAK